MREFRLPFLQVLAVRQIVRHYLCRQRCLPAYPICYLCCEDWLLTLCTCGYEFDPQTGQVEDPAACE